MCDIVLLLFSLLLQGLMRQGSWERGRPSELGRSPELENGGLRASGEAERARYVGLKSVMCDTFLLSFWLLLQGLMRGGPWERGRPRELGRSPELENGGLRGSGEAERARYVHPKSVM